MPKNTHNAKTCVLPPAISHVGMLTEAPHKQASASSPPPRPKSRDIQAVCRLRFGGLMASSFLFVLLMTVKRFDQRRDPKPREEGHPASCRREPLHRARPTEAKSTNCKQFAARGPEEAGQAQGPHNSRPAERPAQNPETRNGTSRGEGNPPTPTGGRTGANPTTQIRN